MVRALVIDDEGGVARVVKAMLEADGHEAEIASNGKDALSRLPDFAPDLVLVDLLMPDMDGIEVTRAVIDQRPDICIVVMTGAGAIHEPAVTLCRRLGARGVLHKPMTHEQLRETVTNALTNQ